MENLEENKEAAERASEAAFELEISRETRDFIKKLPNTSSIKNSKKPLYFASIAASLLILIVSVITINVSHSNKQIAGKFGINALVARSGNNVDNDDFRKAVQAYYAKDYEESSDLLSGLGLDGGRIKEYKDWLLLLIELQTSGSTSETFSKQVDSIIANEDHEFHLQAIEIKKDLSLFWRNFVVRK